MNVMHLMFTRVIWPKSRYVNSEATQARLRIRDDIFVGDGVMGIRGVKQEAHNVESIIP